MQTFSQMLYQAGGAISTTPASRSLSNDAGVTALDYLVSFYKDGLANPNVVYQGTGPRPLVLGIAAMSYNSVSVEQNAAENKPDVDKYILAGLPLRDEPGGTPTTIAWINKFAISANTKDPDGAWALLSFLTSKDISDKLPNCGAGCRRAPTSATPPVSTRSARASWRPPNMRARCRPARTCCRSSSR